MALLEHIEAEMERLYWNKYQEDFPSPFRNNAEDFKNETFEVHSYDWSENPKYHYNFKCGDVEISWYKNLGRHTTIDKWCLPEEIIETFNKCMISLGEEWHNEYDD